MSAYQTQADPTAVQGRRIGAWIIDVVIIIALGFLLSLAFPFSDNVTGNVCEARGVTDSWFDSDDLDNADSSETTDSEICFDDGDLILFSETESAVLHLDQALWPNLVSLAYVIGVFWIWQGLTGMTPGKAIVSIRTVNEAGEKPGILKAFLRSLMWIVDAFPYCCIAPVTGGITMLASKSHRRVGDMVAKTYVVDKRSMGAGPIIVPGADHPPTYVPPAAPAGPFVATPPPGSTTATSGGLTPPPAPAAPATPGEAVDSGPEWDPQRGAYIQWDQTQEAWLQFDDESQTWKPLST